MVVAAFLLDLSLSLSLSVPRVFCVKNICCVYELIFCQDNIVWMRRMKRRKMINSDILVLCIVKIMYGNPLS